MSATTQRVKEFYASNSPVFLADGEDIPSGAEDLSIHRALLDPATGEHSPDIVNVDIHALLRSRLSGIAVPRILDAGCGWGGTLRHLAERMPMRGVGVTLCPVQADIARRAVRGVAGADITIVEGDFCADLPDGAFGGPYDAIIAVESIAHTADYAASLGLLADRLAPGGVLVVVDDFLSEGAKRDETLVALFRAGWIVEAVDGFEAIRTALAREKSLTLDCVADYSDRVFRREADICAAMLEGVTPVSLAAETDDRERCRIGGIALEQLYAESGMRYLMATVSAPGAER